MANIDPATLHSLNTTADIVTTLITSNTSQLAAFAGGCFWGMEHLFRRHFDIPHQILDVKVGYANGNSNVYSPSYESVCTGNTNCAETVLISYIPENITYGDLTNFFFHIHDPTTLNKQGPDNVGTQYRSGIYYTTPEQQQIASDLKRLVQEEWLPNDTVVTEIEPLLSFYDAEPYHQLYLEINENGYHCPSHYLRDTPGH
ncbi:peptide-methionine (S)-S-oxide reductase [Pichia kudriavzevii]|uniref:peptide-methionine (S)-S-oxide reductase n=2 Tax=Pichia kudriavzevii TaxID=4909 RepID=A0A1Z8JSA7_PICKU|nr:uncharacterized protein C5L36_0A05900 [Pichia kudriavzevii]AWU73995.1 hypothetical protein C5L36_0A05900 [Pichia kudriavzevii]OUT23475.1 peptide-methionine (S)-S-oxide reductase [Pichia kudriavzevii]